MSSPIANFSKRYAKPVLRHVGRPKYRNYHYNSDDDNSKVDSDSSDEDFGTILKEAKQPQFQRRVFQSLLQHFDHGTADDYYELEADLRDVTPGKLLATLHFLRNSFPQLSQKAELIIRIFRHHPDFQAQLQQALEEYDNRLLPEHSTFAITNNQFIQTILEQLQKYQTI